METRTSELESYPSRVAVNLKLAVPTGWPSFDTSKLADWAAAEAEAKAREPAKNTRKAKVRIRVFPITDQLDTNSKKRLHGRQAWFGWVKQKSGCSEAGTYTRRSMGALSPLEC